MCSFLETGGGYLAPSGWYTGRGDWTTDGQHYRRCQEVQLPVPAAARDTTEGECGLISKHVHSQLARCSPLFHFYRSTLCSSAVFAVVRCLSVCLSSRWCNVSTRLKISSNFLFGPVAPSFYFLAPSADTQFQGETRAQNIQGWIKFAIFD